MTSSDARMPLIRPLIWLTEAANTAGPSKVPTLRTPGSRQSIFGGSNSSRRRNDGNWNSSCAIPATNTPQASAMAGRENRGAATSAAPISDRFSRTGVNAGTA